MVIGFIRVCIGGVVRALVVGVWFVTALRIVNLDCIVDYGCRRCVIGRASLYSWCLGIVIRLALSLLPCLVLLVCCIWCNKARLLI